MDQFTLEVIFILRIAITLSVFMSLQDQSNCVG